MRYLSFVHDGISSWGMLGESGIVDLGQHLGARFPDLRSYIAAGYPDAASLAALPAAVALETVTLAPVIPNPDKIVMAALNYYEPGQDRDDKPDYPVLFLRLPASQIGHGAPLIQPRSSQKLDYEGELAVIIGKGGRHIAREEAQSHVAGYAIYNDGSVRDWQRHSHQFTPGKNFVGTGAFGPWMVSSDALSLPPEGLSLVTRVNGVEKQRTDTSRMIFDVPYLISYISTFTPLEPGDVIVTGTCEGFGATRTPQEFLTPGDLVEVEIDGLGLLANRVAVEAS
ncbi:fumarylacetoacetate hydrolase family protein [Devosia neptuniae]|jgi:2-keto-4-pentenoate hydratase/2-oxohepta-3-ene-1,7-dioic acid hydratase in catechol pathway|uniref:fumarylacetoacetate hydrolase family protein n=1 Tax=Devosia TaxID=46913 RepID=UPI0022AEAEE4|nr:fumarylacetoacetate hydrolase family protein [Devosia neptuniae]MCZ4346198.1 fumarylacetoacetate hydrolase family protein [Devosia neptuniae]|tara:strand:+ start:19947 stop:20795 length:849 start_codon:yes stop_codon:yes gene_type:complete